MGLDAKRLIELKEAVDNEGLAYALIHYDDFSDVGGEIGEKIKEFVKLYDYLNDILG